MMDARAREQIRQERETFDQAKAHDASWFTLRLAMGYAGIGLLLAIASVSSYILLHPECYAAATIAIATSVLLVDMLGVVISIFKLVLQQGSALPLKPVTGVRSDSVNVGTGSGFPPGQRSRFRRARLESSDLAFGECPRRH